MTETFGIVLLLVGVVGVVVAVVIAWRGDDVWDQIGSGGLSLDQSSMPMRREPAPGSHAAKTERDAEIRQMLTARNDRRIRKGQEPLDIESELQRLLAPPPPQMDDDLREEVRQLVLARNERRIRKGQEPLDVEAEIDRRLDELT